MIKIAVENAIICGKKYVHFAEICENGATCKICGIRIFALN